MLKKIGQFLLGVIICGVALYGAFWWIAEPAAPHDYRAETPLIYAHQGGAGQGPDNTLYAFRQAAAMGVDVLELDIHATAEGELVVIHDASINRTTNGSGRIKEMTLTQIKALDAAYRWNETADYPLRGQGITVPLLTEVLTAFPDMRMNIEIKQIDPPIAEALCSLLNQYRRADKTLVASFSITTIEAFREACPGVATGASSSEVIAFYILSLLHLDAAYSPHSSVLQVPEYRLGRHIVTADFVRKAQARNIAVVVWTINETEDMQRMIDLGVDGIITDYPERLANLLTAK